MQQSEMRESFLPYGHQSIDNDDIAAVTAALMADRITTGPLVEKFEAKVAEYCRAAYGIAMSSGTAALHAAYYAAGVSAGDEVITTPITFFATVSQIMACGGTPVFADVDRETANIDPEEIERRITTKTVAVAPVDYAGHPVDLDEIRLIARDRDLVVIEDACHALGATYREHKIGGISDMTVFSFHPVKAITTGEGGMVLTNNRIYRDRLRLFREHNIRRSVNHWEYTIHDAGFNYRLSDIQCSLGISQLTKLDRFIARRREIAVAYTRAFSGVVSISTPTEQEYAQSAYHLYPIRLSGVDRDGFIRALAVKNIGTQVHYIPCHWHPCMRPFGYRRGDFPIAESFYGSVVSLPIFPAMSDSDVADVVRTVLESVRQT